ncbi:S-layer homology domain-containing protein [Aeromicrobium alkaliterrae]|uniref:SLH domain-containing protein n=1 Tax=Aeromicrobium alkaliterrae TaxID=302168 RepID=A0ABN2JET4_9ACTN
MRRLIALGAAVVLLAAGTPAPTSAASATFVDVPRSHVFLDEITWLADEGISRGYPGPGGTRFDPSAPVLREQMAAFLYRVAGEPEVEVPVVSPFVDVSPQHVFFKPIVWLASTGVSTGYTEPGGKKSFRPSQPVLREQMAAFLYRLRDADIGVTDVPPLSSDLELFTDVAGSHVFFDQILWLAYVGITTGYEEEDGISFRPSQPVLREQMAAFLHRYERPVFGGTFRLVAPTETMLSMSDDGRTVVHGASYTLPDTSVVGGVSVWDRDAGESTPVVDLDGEAHYVDGGLLSGDGRWLAVTSASARMAPGDVQDDDIDVFLIDRATDERVKVSQGSTSRWSSTDAGLASLSADGRYVVFSSWANDVVDHDLPSGVNLYRWDRETGETIAINHAPWPQFTSGVGGGQASADGSRIVFWSAGAEVPEDDNGLADAYLWDDGDITLLSRAVGGGPGNAASYVDLISPDGRFVKVRSSATDLVAEHDPYVDEYLWDAESGSLEKGPRATHFGGTGEEIVGFQRLFSSHPDYFAFAWDRSDLIPDANGGTQVLMLDETTGSIDVITRMPDGSLPFNGFHSSPRMSADGRYVVFSARSSALIDGHEQDGLFSWDRFGID